MSLVKLTITPCSVDSRSGQTTPQSSQAFAVMINPAKYSHSREISYSKKKTIGQLASQTRFNAIESENISFDLVIDGTGVISSTDDVKTQLKKLNDTVYKYVGANHEPNHVQLVWGSLLFFGRLTQMSVDYSLFKPSGDPLRASVKLAFRGFMTSKEEQERSGRSSPDLTHIVEVRAGDTLPLLCHRIYKDQSYYPEVARINNIVNFRNLRPGDRLHFPPLE